MAKKRRRKTRKTPLTHAGAVMELVKTLFRHAREHTWERDRDSCGFDKNECRATLSYCQASRDFGGAGSLDGVDGRFSDWTSAIQSDSAGEQFTVGVRGNVVVTCYHNCPEYCDDEGDATATINFRWADDVEKAVSDAVTAFYYDKVNSIPEAAYEAEYLAAVQKMLVTMRARRNPSPERDAKLITAMNQLAHAVTCEAVEVEAAAIGSQHPVLAGLRWQGGQGDEAETAVAVFTTLTTPDGGKLECQVDREKGYPVVEFSDALLTTLAGGPASDLTRAELEAEAGEALPDFETLKGFSENAMHAKEWVLEWAFPVMASEPA